MERDSSNEPTSVFPAIQRKVQEGCTEISPEHGMGVSGVGKFIHILGFLEGELRRQAGFWVN